MNTFSSRVQMKCAQQSLPFKCKCWEYLKVQLFTFLTQFIYKLSGHPPKAIVNKLKPANTSEALNAKQSSSNLSREQPRVRPVCANLPSPPHPYYGYLHCSPRIRNYNAGAPPNITVTPQGFRRMMSPDQTNWFLSYSPLDSPNYSSPYVQVTSFLRAIFILLLFSSNFIGGGEGGIPTYR